MEERYRMHGRPQVKRNGHCVSGDKTAVLMSMVVVAGRAGGGGGGHEEVAGEVAQQAAESLSG